MRATAGIILGLAATSVSASPIDPSIHGSLVTPEYQDCAGRLVPNAAPFSPPPFEKQISKSAAILGGQLSALERIRLAQEGARTDITLIAENSLADGSIPQPAAGGLRTSVSRCVDAAAFVSVAPPNGEDFLASRRLEISRTVFDRDWNRVNADSISATRYQSLVGSADGEGLEIMARVNRWVNRSVDFAEDRDLFGRADFWAGASLTLALRKGDCEDIALTKLKLLSAAGIQNEDMVLTIARDLVRNADHAVLIVRHNGTFYLLDNTTDEVLDASGSHDYRPIVSYSRDQAWIHGY